MLASTMAAALLLVGCGGDDDDSTSASGTTAAPAAQVTARAEFAGESCDYDGPDDVSVGDELSITVVNTTDDEEVGFALWKVPDGTTAAEIIADGIFEIVGPNDQAHDLVFTPTEQDREYDLTAVIDVGGTWAVNCFVLAEGGDVEYPTVFTASEG